MAVDMNRNWMIVNHTIKPEEKGHIHDTLAGIVLGGRSPVRTFADRINTNERDVVYIAPDRLVVVVPKAPRDMRLRDLPRLAAGDVSRAATIISVPRDDVTKVVCPCPQPDNFPVLDMGDATFAEIDVIYKRRRELIYMWIDTETVPLDDFEDKTHRWLAGTLDDS